MEDTLEVIAPAVPVDGNGNVSARPDAHTQKYDRQLRLAVQYLILFPTLTETCLV